MRQVYPVIFTPLNDKKDTVLIEVPDWEILTEGYGMADAVEMARDAIGLKGITYEDKEKKFPEASSINEIDTSRVLLQKMENVMYHLLILILQSIEGE